MIAPLRQGLMLICLAVLSVGSVVVGTGPSRSRLEAAQDELTVLAGNEAELHIRMSTLTAAKALKGEFPAELIWPGIDDASVEIAQQQTLLDFANAAALQILSFGATQGPENIGHPTKAYEIEVEVRLLDGTVWTTLADAITYKPNGPLASMVYGDGYTQTRSYDTSYRLTGLTDSNGTNTLRQMTYGYESRDNLTTVTDAVTPANSETYSYTPRESLASATGSYGQMAFTYDGVGNRVGYAVDPGTGSVTDSYSYPTTSNRLSNIALGAGGSRALSYDAAGNVTLDDRTGGGYSYSYDSAGRMATFSINGVLQAAYKYDFQGRQAVRALSGGLTIHSVFDSDGNRIAEYNEATGSLIREYVWLDGAPIAVIEGGVISYVRTDHIGRPVFATNAAGAIVWTASYLPFGGVSTTSGIPPLLRFPGQWFQTESGLHQNWMRDYDPTTGRYLQADPLGLIDGASVYGYARQSPAMFTDPTGECPVCVVAAIWAGWMLVDYLLDDGCYTWGDFVFSAVTNLDPFKVTKWAKAVKAAKARKWTTTARGAKGRDGGHSEHIFEKIDDRTNSRTHRVTNTEGEVIHQHQTYHGKYGSERVFPDEWSDYPFVE